MRTLALFAHEKRFSCLLTLREAYPDWLTAQEIAGGINAPARQAKVYLSMLADRGFVVKARRGHELRYRLVQRHLTEIFEGVMDELPDHMAPTCQPTLERLSG